MKFEIIDRNQSSRCLNDHIDLPEEVRSNFSCVVMEMKLRNFENNKLTIKNS